MWTISSIDEADYGCEERMPGIPQMVLVSLESDNGEFVSFEVPEEWLSSEGLDVGDEWPEEIEKDNEDSQRASDQMEWLEKYKEAMDELENE